MRRLGWAVGRNPFRLAVFDMDEFPHRPLIIVSEIWEARQFIHDYELEQVRI